MKRMLACSVVVLLTALAVRAEIVSFETVTTNSPNREVITQQLFIDTGLSSIIFTNSGSADSSITEIYFGTDLTDLNLNIDSVISCSDGVSFTIEGAKPPNPPGYDEFDNWWLVTVAAAESEPPASNGINPLEYLELGLSYESSSSFTELLQSGEVQVALHVSDIGPDNEYSDTFVNVVPEPASMGLMTLIAGGIYFTRRFFPAI